MKPDILKPGTRRTGWAIMVETHGGPIFFTNGWADTLPRTMLWVREVNSAHLWRSWEGAKAAADEWGLPINTYRLIEYDFEVGPDT